MSTPAITRRLANVCLLLFMINSRHTFASDMIRAGMSLPALMQLMGHSDIQTTLHYVQVTPQDVYLQYARAVAQHIRPLPVTAS
jgi:integrase